MTSSNEMSPKYDFICGNLFTQNVNHISPKHNHNDYHICFEQRARRPAGISVWRAVISVILYFQSSGVRLSGVRSGEGNQSLPLLLGLFLIFSSSLVHVRVGITYFLPLFSNLLSEKYYKNSFLWGKYH